MLNITQTEVENVASPCENWAKRGTVTLNQLHNTYNIINIYLNEN